MTDKNAIRVEEVKTSPLVGNPPKVRNPVFGYGITSKIAASVWAEKNKYQYVYWWRARQRVYAELKTGAA